MLTETARIGGGAEGGIAQTAFAHPATSASKPFEPAAPPSGGDSASAPPRLGPNPAITYDSETRTILFQVMDSETGEVKRQFPPEHQVEAYRRQIRLNPEEKTAEKTEAGNDPAPAPPLAAPAATAEAAPTAELLV